LADLSFSPNLKAENWTNPKDVTWREKGWNIVEKAPLGISVRNLSTNDQYLINPIYETEIMTDTTKKSVIMSLVRHRPVMGPPIFFPMRDGAGWSFTGSPPTGSRLPEVSRKVRNGWS
jgi:hypothetical protein